MFAAFFCAGSLGVFGGGRGRAFLGLWGEKRAAIRSVEGLSGAGRGVSVRWTGFWELGGGHPFGGRVFESWKEDIRGGTGFQELGRGYPFGGRVFRSREEAIRSVDGFLGAGRGPSVRWMGFLPVYRDGACFLRVFLGGRKGVLRGWRGLVPVLCNLRSAMPGLRLFSPWFAGCPAGLHTTKKTNARHLSAEKQGAGHF